MGEHKYVHSVEKDEVELERLMLQAGIYDSTTSRRLEMTGIAAGWKCLEVAAGAGSVAEWLSTRVGPSGRVVATDIDLKFLQRVSAPNLEVRRHDITKDPLEKGEYDLAHCRFLLMHMAEPETVLRRMVDALRPGGWLVVEDHDLGSELSCDVTDPSAALVASTFRAMFDYLRKMGIADLYFGRRLRGLVEQLGLVDTGQDGWTRIWRGGEFADLQLSTYEAFSRPMIASGLLTQEDHDSVLRVIMDPAFYYPGPTVFAAWGRKPIQGGGT